MKKQQGFTLIELIVVIVILGILAATALPKFIDMGSSARYAKLSAGLGSLQSAAELAHASYLVSGTSPSSIIMEGVTVTMLNSSTAGGYPDSGSIAAAAGMTSATGWTVANTSPTATFTVSGGAATCTVTYTNGTAATSGVPTITPQATSSAQC